MVLNAAERNEHKKIRTYNELYQQEMAKRKITNTGNKHRAAATAAKKASQEMKWRSL